jgi:hypothetical protein
MPDAPPSALNDEIAQLEAVIDRQRRFAEQLDWAGIDPTDTLALVGRLEHRLAGLRAARAAVELPSAPTGAILSG